MTTCVTVLVAGIAGLSAAFEAQKQGVETQVYEASDAPGGLLKNFSIEGFRFDTCVHLSFASEPAVRDIFDQTPYHAHKPDPQSWDDFRWLRHPVQNNLYPLPAEEKIELIAGLVAQKEAPEQLDD